MRHAAEKMGTTARTNQSSINKLMPSSSFSRMQQLTGRVMAGMGARNALAMVKAKRVIMRRNMVKKLSGYLDCNQMM